MPTKLPWPMRREPNAASCARILFSSCTPSGHSLRGDTDHSLYRLSQKLIDKRTDTPCLTKRRNSKSRFALGRSAYDGSKKPKSFNFPAKFCRNLRIAGQKISLVYGMHALVQFFGGCPRIYSLLLPNQSLLYQKFIIF